MREKGVREKSIDAQRFATKNNFIEKTWRHLRMLLRRYRGKRCIFEDGGLQECSDPLYIYALIQFSGRREKEGRNIIHLFRMWPMLLYCCGSQRDSSKKGGKYRDFRFASRGQFGVALRGIQKRLNWDAEKIQKCEDDLFETLRIFSQIFFLSNLQVRRATWAPA